MTAPNGNRASWTLIGLLVGMLIAGAPFIVAGIGKPDRTELERVIERMDERLAAIDMRDDQQDRTLTDYGVRLDFLTAALNASPGAPP